VLRVTAAGHDDAQTACEHVWALKGVHLSLRRGAEFEDECSACGTVRYRTGEGYEQQPPAG
jgi:hypothetical protein